MRLVACPGCGRELRPSNLVRHFRARHLPKPLAAPWGTEWLTPEQPLPGGWTHDKRYDDHIPRGAGDHRYRIYRLRAGQLDVVGTTDSDTQIGPALNDLYKNGVIGGSDDSIGFMDTSFEPGRWVVSPFTLGRRKETR